MYCHVYVSYPYGPITQAVNWSIFQIMSLEIPFSRVSSLSCNFSLFFSSILFFNSMCYKYPDGDNRRKKLQRQFKNYVNDPFAFPFQKGVFKNNVFLSFFHLHSSFFCFCSYYIFFLVFFLYSWTCCIVLCFIEIIVCYCLVNILRFFLWKSCFNWINFFNKFKFFPKKKKKQIQEVLSYMFTLISS